MAMTMGNSLYYDPYDLDIQADPFPTLKRMREEAPLYYNEQHDFFALSLYDDVKDCLLDHRTYSSARGNVLELIKANLNLPPGVFIAEDPPIHTMHRSIVSRVFTPRKMQALEPQIRAFCAQVLDPLVGAGRLDFVRDLGAQMPIQVIGMLLGVPEEDLQAVREQGDEKLRRKPGKPNKFSESGMKGLADGTFFADYIDWRADHPSDDLMTALLQTEFEDDAGTQRHLTREEILIFVNLLSIAGNETTNRTIGWIGKMLGDHPEQRRELVAHRDLIPNAVEEVVRCQPPALQACRYVTRDVEFHGQAVPEGSVLMLMLASANRDESQFPNGDAFDIHRKTSHSLSFGYGIHFCLGAALARLEGRLALDEILDRFPEWSVDEANAELDSSMVRGWRSLPVTTP